MTAPEAPMAIDVPPFDQCDHLDRARVVPHIGKPGTARDIGVIAVASLLIGTLIGLVF